MATKKPTGLAIKNDGNKFTLSWKKGEAYGDGIRLEYEYGYAKGNSVKRAKSGTLKLSGSAHNKVIKITKDKLTYVSFKVRGKANGEAWSAWAEKEFTIQEPNVPTLEAVWDENRPNETVFNWTASESTHRLFTRAEYQSIWVENCPDDIHAETLWSSAEIVQLTNKSGSITETEADTSGSHARIVRVRSYGLGGYSAWRYAYHVYAIPFEPVITSIDATKSEHYMLTVKYTQQSDEMQHPVGGTAVAYCYGVPSANYEPPLNAQWNLLTTPVDRGDNTWQGIIYTTLNDDEMLWVRVSATYDNHTVESGYEVIDYGELAEPSNLSTTPNQSTHTVAVTATNNSQQADSVLAVIYQDPITNESAIMGVIPHGSTTATVVVPAWSDSVGKIGVQAISGQYTAQPARPDGVITYDFKVWAQSQIKWSGTPQAPEITVTRANDDTAVVMWSWPYENADKAEISWSDRPDAWESTEEPETYEVSNLHASKWNVGGLDLGKTWYFRVRLFYTSGDANIYGTYSRTATLDLSSEPDKPVLSLTDTVIDEAGETTASWGYISTDGAPQTRAELARIYYGEVWNHTIFDAVASQQHYVIDAKQLGAESGEQVPIAVRVYSASGQVSAWSDPVTLTIADPLTCTIAQDSLEYDTTEINPETYEGDIVTLDGGTDNVKDVTALTVSLSPVQAGTPSQDDTVYNEPYLEKDSPSFNSEYDKLVGASVIANQLAKVTGISRTVNGITYTVDTVNGTITANGTSTGRSNISISGTVADRIPYVSGHKYLASIGREDGSLATYHGSLVFYKDATYVSYQQFAQTMIFANTRDFNNIAFEVVGAEASGVTVTNVKFVPQFIDLTAYFGSATIPDRIYSMEQSQAGSGIAFLKSYDFFTKDYYPYNAGTLQSVKPTAHVTSQSYPLAGTELRGVYQLVNNKIVAYGDTQEHTGLTTQKFGVVDLGSLDWETQSGNNYANFFSRGLASVLNYNASTPTIICSVYKAEANDTASATDDKYIWINSGKTVRIKDTSKASLSVADFKTAMSGVYLIYELATPTTETLTGFTSPQAVGTTESYTDNRDFPVPVGHESRYANIYPITGHDVIETYVSPTTESEDGTTYETDLTSRDAQFVYGGTADIVNGTGTSEWANIASYNGETITEPWLSSMDVYSAGATPTTGAQVVYKLSEPQTLTFTPQQVSLNSGTNNVWSDAGDVTVKVADAVESGYYLTEMPLSVTVTGAGTAGRTTALIERAEDYVMDRPDETVTAGHVGQVVAQAIQTGEEQIIFALDNLIGKLDDGARYNLVAITQDNLGRTARDVKEFTVRWAHQAVMASGTAIIENGIAKLTVTQPAGALATDTVDIYRLSQDRPELVVSGAAFGDTWVDPYPTVGTGGYRFVLITANGDYITADDVPSWVDVPASLDNMSHIIDFNGIEIMLSHNIKINNEFDKDFEAVQYLGGSIKGYWKRGVRRSGDADAVVVTDDPDLIKNLRRLAVYEGHCHVRTADGSSYTADVQVNDDEGFDTAGKIYSCSLDITKIDPVQPDGVLLTDWEAS